MLKEKNAPSSAVFEMDGFKQLSVEDLSLFISAINSQYKRCLRKAGIDKEDDKEKSLFIREIRTSSLFVELVQYIGPAVPLMPELINNYDKVKVFLPYLSGVIKYISGETSVVPSPPLGSTDYKDIHGLVAPIANNPGSTITVNNIINNGDVINNINLNNKEATAIQQNCEKFLTASAESKTENKVVFKWHQTRFDQNVTSGDKGIIDKIAPNAPLKVIFARDNDKSGMMKKDDRFDKPWQELCYVVDVEVDIDAIKNRPRAYKILNYYSEDTFED